MTWNDKPTAGTTVRGTGTVTGTTAKWYEVDLTAFLQAEKAAGRNVVTLVIKRDGRQRVHDLFDSDEAATNRPELRRELTEEGFTTETRRHGGAPTRQGNIQPELLNRSFLRTLTE